MNLIKDVEEVESFKFLGSTINSKRDCSQEIRRRLAIVRSVVQSLIKFGHCEECGSELDKVVEE